MPFYEYECPACKYYAEVMQKISDAPLNKCPSCGKPGMKKLVSAPVFRLKGAGWYETDFKSDKENKRNLHGADKEEAKPESKAETKEVKPEGKETKEAKETKEPKEAKDTKAAGGPKGSTGSTARTVSVPGKTARPAAARRPVRAAGRKAARKHRR